jgi:hypothetical protein
MTKSNKATSEAKIHSPETTPEVVESWSRLPKPSEVEKRSGLNRHAINKLILGENPMVVSRSLKSTPSAKRCIRLVKITGKGSLLEFLNKEEV